MENSRSVRRPQSGTWQSGSNGGGGTGTHVTLWTQQQRDQAVRGPMADYRPWQQQWEARNLSAPYGKNGTHQQCVRRPESGTWQNSSNGRPYRDP
ncbi:unnamed protein product [Staurois parvus]|uniref:Uncharacterized protein n=1 Tax=Staurois parvus TaxID=386267 RepID=A0ABN9HE41_9NEOB|nr:unnamed protein product [Staurois parvus]